MKLIKPGEHWRRMEISISIPPVFTPGSSGILDTSGGFCGKVSSSAAFAQYLALGGAVGIMIELPSCRMAY